MTRAEFIEKYGGDNPGEFTKEFDETVSEMLTVIVKTERKEPVVTKEELVELFRELGHTEWKEKEGKSTTWYFEEMADAVLKLIKGDGRSGER